MKTQRMTSQAVTSLGTGLMIALLLTISATPAFAADFTLKVNVPFAFRLNSETLPAGDYTFFVDRGADMVSINGPKGSGGNIPLMTLLGPARTNDWDGHLVFDKVGNTYQLSEVWQPGAEGVLISAAKGEHEHHIVHAQP